MLKYIINYQSRDKRMSDFPMFFTWNIINGSSVIYDIIINCGNKSGMLIQTSTSKYEFVIRSFKLEVRQMWAAFYFLNMGITLTLVYSNHNPKFENYKIVPNTWNQPWRCFIFSMQTHAELCVTCTINLKLNYDIDTRYIFK